MTIFARIGDFFAVTAASALAGVTEAVRTVFSGDAETRRKVAFSVAMIALSAKMAKADGVVTQDEVRAFQKLFSVPEGEQANVARLYNLATGDVAGFEAYAQQMMGLCGSGQTNCPMMEDILDGLFYIAKADGALHERELAYLERVAQIFKFDEERFARVLARHAEDGARDPWQVLGIARTLSFDAVRKHYRKLAAENHPDRMIARGAPAEFIAIAHDRMSAINAAFDTIERMARAA